jgi:enoyl-CoA hydratase/carnithine racemase
MSSGQVPSTRLPATYPDLPYQEIKISHHPASSKEPTPVIICTLYRPKQNNAYTDVMTDELEHFFALASIDDRVKAIVVTGEGRMFCAGQDLNQGR